MEKTRQALIDLVSASFQERTTMTISLKPHAQVVMTFGYSRYVPVVITEMRDGVIEPVFSTEKLEEIPEAVDEFMKYVPQMPEQKQ